MAVVLCGILIAGIISGSLTFLVYGKYEGIGLAVVGLTGAYYLIDNKQLSAKIPLRKERTASLTRRTLESYVRPSLVLSVKAGALFVGVAIVVSFFIHRITLATLLYDMLFAGFTYFVIWAGIQLGLKEKIPHQNDISQVTKINVGENYRSFSMNLLIGMLFFITILTLFILGLQWFGLDIMHDGTKDALHRLLGEPVPVCRPVFNLLQWDIIYSILSTVLFIWIAKCRPFRDILSIKIKPARQS
jgi:hypothetical protein